VRPQATVVGHATSKLAVGLSEPDGAVDDHDCQPESCARRDLQYGVHGSARCLNIDICQEPASFYSRRLAE
jgi:hypothetical protein